MPFPPDHPISTLYESRTFGPQQVRQQRDRHLREIVAVYSRIADDILADDTTGDITAGRAERLRRSVAASLQRLTDQFGANLDEGLRDFIQRTLQSHATAGEAVASEFDAPPPSASFTEVPETVVRQMMARRSRGLSSTFQTIADFQRQEMVDEIDDLITSNVARGVSARRFKQQLATKLVADDPAVKAMMEQSGSLLDLDDVDDTATGARMERAQEALYRSRMIAVTETNQANFEANRFAAQESRVVEAVKWQLSGRHAGLRSSPDICDVLAQQVAYDELGPGIYYPETLPAHPHPHCQCTTLYVTRDPSEWDEDAPSPPDAAPQTDRATVDRLLRENGGDPTDRRVERFQETLNQHQLQAHDTYRERRGSGAVAS